MNEQKHSVKHYKDKFIKILQKIYFVYLFFRVSGTNVFVSDAAVDTVMSGGETLIATALGSAAAGAIGGSFAPGVGNIVGAVVGFGTGIGLYFLDNSDFDGNGKTLREDVKDSVYCAFMD